MEKGLFLTELMQQEDIQLMKGKLNLIHAPCGCGKSSWIFNDLIHKYPEKRRIVYLVDTLMLKDSILSKYDGDFEAENYVELTDYRTELTEELFVTEPKPDTEALEYSQTITVMPYNKFGLIMKNKPELIKELDLIILDEVHNLVRYSNFKGDKIKNLADEGTNVMDVHEALKHVSNAGRLLYALPDISKQCDVVMLTATPNNILSHELLKPYVRDILGKYKRRLRRYKEIEKIEFSHIDNIYDRFKDIETFRKTGEKILMFSDTISSCENLKKDIGEMGYNTECLWSTSNSKQMTKKQLALREYIVNKNELPDSIEVLIINDAYSTGWDLHDVDCKINVMICNSSNWDTITQFRGRVRHDIGVLYHRNGKALENQQITLDFKWLDIELAVEDKTALSKELDIKNKNGRLLKWTSIKKMLIDSNYMIKEKRVVKDNSRVNVAIVSLQTD